MKLLLIISLTVITAFHVFSQNEKVGLGIKAGLAFPFNKYTQDPSGVPTNIGGYYWRGDYSMTVKADFTAGIFYRYAKNKFYMMPEVMFSRRGAAMKGEMDGINVPAETIGHITLKRFAHQYSVDLNILSGAKMKNFIVAGGLSLAINIKNKEVIKFKEEIQTLNGNALKKVENDFDADPVDVGIIV